jgi:hypothetical protein
MRKLKLTRRSTMAAASTRFPDTLIPSLSAQLEIDFCLARFNVTQNPNFRHCAERTNRLKLSTRSITRVKRVPASDSMRDMQKSFRCYPQSAFISFMSQCQKPTFGIR